MDSSLWLALLAGVGVAAASGLRAFLPLLVLGIAARLGMIELQPGARWLASSPAVVCFGAAAVLEILGDKVPVVDHMLDLVGTMLRPAAAWLGSYAVLAHWPAPWGQVVAVVLGGGALLLHAAKAKLRLGSTAVTFGHGNPLLSLAEDATAAMLLVAAILAPIVSLFLVILAVWALGARRRKRAVAA